MTKNELNKKAEELFKQYTKEDNFYCIEDGNFWFSKDKGSAVIYSKKLNKELINISKEDIKKEIVKPKVTKKKSKTVSKSNNKK